MQSRSSRSLPEPRLRHRRQEEFVASFFLVPHRPLADPPLLKLAAGLRLPYYIAAASKEVGLSMVRESPFFSLTRGSSNTPTGAKGQQCPRSTFVRVLFREVPTLAAGVEER
jgi:hypothetical protein